MEGGRGGGVVMFDVVLLLLGILCLVLFLLMSVYRPRDQ